MPGDLTIYYGPWPWDNPPLIWFRPMALLFDIFAGAVLVCLAAFLVEYWLRFGRKPIAGSPQLAKRCEFPSSAASRAATTWK